jgi:ABC-type polysaccharide/polyol phosphate export permease
MIIVLLMFLGHNKAQKSFNFLFPFCVLPIALCAIGSQQFSRVAGHKYQYYKYFLHSIIQAKFFTCTLK